MDQSDIENRLLGGLGSWTEGSGPLYSRLADALRGAIAQGTLAPGTRLPAERMLAQLVHVSRGTVVAAYNALEQEGALERRQGSGTVVRMPGLPREDELPKTAQLSAMVSGPEPQIDLSLAAPPSTELPLAQSITIEDIAAVSPLLGYAPLGLPVMRERIAERFTADGLETVPEQILITTGAQQAISLIAAMELSPGEQAALETPTYPGVIEALARAGARLAPLELDHSGARPDSLRRLLDRPPRLMHLTPTCQNPTGRVMPEGRRRELLSLARAHDVTVIDDTVMEELTFAGARPPRLASLAEEGVFTIGSLSKTLWGGLRIGWVRAPASTILRLGRLKVALDLGTPAPSQALALVLLPGLDETIAGRRESLRERMEALTGEVARMLPEWEWTQPRGGYALWVKLPRGASGDQFAALALRHGVAVSPGSSFSPADEHLDHIRICFGLDSDTLRRAVPKLAQAWRELESQAGAARSSPVVAV